MSFSIIIPLLNEEKSLLPICKQLTTQLDKISENDYELIFVDDGSTDQSFDVVRKLATDDHRIKAVRFRKNYGKSAALSQGFQLAGGDIIVTMDGDLQDDPTEIRNLIDTLHQGFDLVSGWRKERKDSIRKIIFSKAWNLVTSWISGLRLHDFNCGLKAYRRCVVESVPCYGEMHRYLPALAHWRGFRVTEIPVRHHARRFGSSKFDRPRFLKSLMDLLTISFLNRYNRSPLHLFGPMGALLLLFGFGINFYFLIRWMIVHEMHLRPLILLAFGAMLMGIQFISLGLLAEMIALKGPPEGYLITEQVNVEQQELSENPTTSRDFETRNVISAR